MKPFIKTGLLSLAKYLILIASLGCSSMQPAMTVSQIAAGPPPKETLGPGDTIEVKFFNTPELNENQIVRPNGTISLQLVGDVNVKGKTPEEVRGDLIRLFTPQLKNPVITVLVRTKDDRKVYVGGEVNTPGVVDLPGNLTPLEAITRSGGFKSPSADPRSVLVVRQNNGKQYGFIVNLEGVLKGQEEQLVLLQPRDVIYVPPKGIAQVNNWVELYINRMLPKVSFGVFYPLAF